MPTEGPAGGLLPADFHETVTVLPGRHDPLATGHHRRHRCVLTRALAEIEIRRGADLARATACITPVSTSPRLPIVAGSALLQCDDVRLVDCFAGLRVTRRVHRLRGQVTGEDIPFELTVADPIPAVLRLAVDHDR